jgi:hypothetical protein
MQGIGNNGDGVGEEATGNLDDGKGSIQKESCCDSGALPLMGVVMRMPC